MQRRFSIIILFGVLGISFGDTLTLENVLQTVRLRNPLIQAAREQVKSKAAIVWPSSFLSNPKVGLTFDPTREMFSSQGWMVASMLMFPLKYPVMGSMAYRMKEMTKEEARFLQAEVERGAKGSYYDYLYTSKSLTLMQEIATILSQYLEVSRRRYETGKTFAWDPLRAETELSELHAQIVGMEAMKKAAIAKILAWMAAPPDTTLGEPIEPQEELRIEKERLTHAIYKNNPMLLASQKEVKVKEKNFQLAWLNFIPDLEFQAEYRELSKMWMYRIMLEVPLFFPLREIQYLKSAKSELTVSRKNYENIKNMLGSELQEALAMIQAGEAQLEVYEKTSLPKAWETLKAAQTGYLSGMMDFLEFLDSEKEYLEIQMQYWKAKSDLGKALAMLENLTWKYPLR